MLTEKDYLRDIDRNIKDVVMEKFELKFWCSGPFRKYPTIGMPT